MAGIALGWALACRPTNLCFASAAALGAVLAAPRLIWPVGCGAALVLIPVGIGMLIVEPLYPTEAARFIQGYAELWGNTALSRPDGEGWATRLRSSPLLAAILALNTIAVILLPLLGSGKDRVVRWSLGAAFLGHMPWIIGFQNPDNLRHLAPLFAVGAVAQAFVIAQLRYPLAPLFAAVALSASCLIISTLWHPAVPAPIQSAARMIATRGDTVLISSYGVQLLRKQLDATQVYDAYYTGTTSLAVSQATDPVFLLTTTDRSDAAPDEILPGRHIGERNLYLYQLPHQPGSD